MSDGSDYFQKCEKYCRAITIVDAVIFVSAVVLSLVFKIKYSFGVALFLIGLIYILFPYTSSRKYTEEKAKTWMRIGGLLCMVVGIVILWRYFCA